MRKKSSYLYLLAIIIITIAAAYTLNIHFIKNATQEIFYKSQMPFIYITAAVCAFIFTGNKRYWLANIACSVATALIVELLIKGHGFSIYTTVIEMFAFLNIVYLLNLAKALITK